MMRRLLAVLGAAALLGAAAGAGYAAALWRVFHHPAPYGLLRQIDALIETRFIDPHVSESRLLYGAARGMLSAVDDPYTRFMDPAAFKEFQESTVSGQFTGIGIVMDLKDGQVMVVSPIPGTPAARAGLLAGDRIVQIDGRPTRDMPLPRAVALIRGPRGSTVHLRIMRGTETRTVAITRDVIQAPSVAGDDVLDPPARAQLRGLRFGYLRVAAFDERTGDEFTRALSRVLRQRPRGLILDLRSNGGGLVEAAVSVANEFVPRGTIVATVDRDGKRTTAEANGTARVHVPVVVLVNEFTASASEILAGALQDDRLATLVGVRTFGKGVVQTIFPLTGGAGAAITTYRYLTPAGRSIHNVGLTPDVPAGTPLAGKPAQEVRRIQDAQLSRAIEVLRARVS